MIEGLEGAQNSITVRLKLERGNPHIVQVVPEIWPKGEQSTCPYKPSRACRGRRVGI